jgi:hypothetical protein
VLWLGYLQQSHPDTVCHSCNFTAADEERCTELPALHDRAHDEQLRSESCSVVSVWENRDVLPV